MCVFIDQLVNRVLCFSSAPDPVSLHDAQLANVLEIDLDLVKVGVHSLLNVALIVMCNLNV